MSGLSEQLLEQALDLTWSLWTEIGVSGWSKGSPNCAVDPEPLILFTVALGDADPRLRDEATDWCIRYGHFVSGTRLRNLLTEENESVQKNFGEFAATIAAHSKQRWPGATSARKYRPTGRSQVDDFSKASMIVLRLRALLGVSARAEIVKVFLSRPDDAFSASDISGETRFAKRHAATAQDGRPSGNPAASKSAALPNEDKGGCAHFRWLSAACFSKLDRRVSSSWDANGNSFQSGRTE
jgi:hypothetical protein